MNNEIASDLRFVGLHQDGEHLILATQDGTQHQLAITEMVRAAVRRDRPALEQLKNEASGFLPPREIQAQIRAGKTAQEVADGANISLNQVRRYEGPVLAEREFLATTAKNTKLAQEPGSPTLGEIVTDRLANRGVDVHSLTWDAYRTEAHGWIIHASYSVDGDLKIAKWAFDQALGSLHALEIEARWLSETSISDEPRRLTAVRPAVYDVEQDPQDGQDSPSPVGQAHPADTESATDQLLEQLDSARGQRPAPDEISQRSGSLAISDQSSQYGRLYSLGSSHKESPAGHDAVIDPPDQHTEPTPVDSEVANGDQGAVSSDPTLPSPAGTDNPDLIADIFGDQPDEDTVSRSNRRGKKQRTRMPSWDEIMFGPKPE